MTASSGDLSAEQGERTVRRRSVFIDVSERQGPATCKVTVAGLISIGQTRPSLSFLPSASRRHPLRPCPRGNSARPPRWGCENAAKAQANAIMTAEGGDCSRNHLGVSGSGSHPHCHARSEVWIARSHAMPKSCVPCRREFFTIERRSARSTFLSRRPCQLRPISTSSSSNAVFPPPQRPVIRSSR